MSSTLLELLNLAQHEMELSPEQLRPDTPFAELGLDSLGVVDFLFNVEDRFHVEIDHGRAMQQPTLRGLATLVDELRANVPLHPALSA